MMYQYRGSEKKQKAKLFRTKAVTY